MAELRATVIERRSSCVILHVQHQRFDAATMVAVKTETMAAGAAAKDLPVVLDLASVGVLPSFALGGLVELTQAFHARGQKLVLANLHPFVRHTVSLVRLNEVFEIVDDLSGFAP